MKILTGSLRGRNIQFRPTPGLRPTADKVRKAIFDTLQGALVDKKVLDLFSGTGAIGFETLSNGAKQVIFVEENKNQVRQISDNLKNLNLLSCTEVICQDSIQAIKDLEDEDQAFDFVFADPPYDKGFTARFLNAISNSPIIGPSSVIVLETRRQEDLPTAIGKLTLIKTKIYGDSKVSFYGFG